LVRRSLLGFISLNIVVTILVTSGVILVNERLRAPGPTPERGLLQVVVTATPDPNVTPPVVYIVVTATQPGAPGEVAILPTPTGGQAPGATLDTALLPAAPGAIDAPTFTPTDPSGCPTHTLAQGEILGTLAVRYSVSVEEIRAANGLTPRDDTRLQIGQVLIIPVGGCGLASRTPTPSPSPTAAITNTPPASATPAPVVARPRLEIVQVIAAGDITEERIVIRNASTGLIEIGGWTLSDARGNVFTFPDAAMFAGREVILYTRADVNTPLALYWGLPSAIWNDPTQTITIRDGGGNVLLTVTLAALRATQSAPVPTPTP
jgi:LysM repeat protein